MPHNALIVIVDPQIRSLTRSVLEADIGATVTEVDTALEGLAWFEMRSFDVVVIDFQFPVVNDFRALGLLCRAANAGATPIVAIIPGEDDPIVGQVMALGIGEIIARPLARTAMSGRLASCVSRTRVGETHPSTPPVLPPGRSVLVVDGDLIFRQFVTYVMRHTARVLAAATGTDALKMALEHPPTLAIIGQGLGLLNGVALATRMRAMSRLGSTRLVAVVPDDQVDAVAASAVYHGVVSRTLVPEVFREQIDRQLDLVEQG